MPSQNTPYRDRLRRLHAEHLLRCPECGRGDACEIGTLRGAVLELIEEGRTDA